MAYEQIGLYYYYVRIRIWSIFDGRIWIRITEVQVSLEIMYRPHQVKKDGHGTVGSQKGKTRGIGGQKSSN
jgi:hypothetical protein